MIHLVFQSPDIAALQKSFELDPSLQGDIIEIADDFAVGPINDLHTEEGKTVNNGGGKCWLVATLTAKWMMVP